MNQYIATVRIKGQSVRTVVFADCSIHARLILEYQFGMNSVINNPSLLTREDRGYRSLDEVLATFKPKTPDQLNIDTLKNQKDQADKRLKAARARQKLAKAQKTIFNLSRPT
jgi:dGTP triphosphohydrolase